MHRAQPPVGLDEATDVLAFTAGVLRELGAVSNDSERLLEALIRIRAVREHLAEWEPRLIDQARAVGVSWAQLAPALGVAAVRTPTGGPPGRQRGLTTGALGSNPSGGQTTTRPCSAPGIAHRPPSWSAIPARARSASEAFTTLVTSVPSSAIIRTWIG
jgi:hypothetical protein